MASYGGERLLNSSSPWSGISSLSSFSIPLPFIFQEAKESIDEKDPSTTSSNGAYIKWYKFLFIKYNQSKMNVMHLNSPWVQQP